MLIRGKPTLVQSRFQPVRRCVEPGDLPRMLLIVRDLDAQSMQYLASPTEESVRELEELFRSTGMAKDGI